MENCQYVLGKESLLPLWNPSQKANTISFFPVLELKILQICPAFSCFAFDEGFFSWPTKYGALHLQEVCTTLRPITNFGFQSSQLLIVRFNKIKAASFSAIKLNCHLAFHVFVVINFVETVFLWPSNPLIFLQEIFLFLKRSKVS